MDIFIDTSALMKRYISEIGSDIIDNLFTKCDTIYVSIITEIEAFSTIRRLLYDKQIGKHEFLHLHNEIETDLQYFTIIDINESVIKLSKDLIMHHSLRTLDSIQLSSALLIKDTIDYFVCSDNRLITAAQNEKMKILNPLKN
ncbi:MAG: type II toxin-antitoxin system VapC family toxin [Spirochaetota bacterium]